MSLADCIAEFRNDFVIVPRVIRDGIYDVIASRRYRWFGRRAVCMVPTPELRQRFLDSQEVPGAS